MSPVERASRLVPLLAAATLVRVAGLLGPGHTGDLDAFVQWAEDSARLGLGNYYAGGGTSNYPPMLYLLWPLGVALDGFDLVFAIRTLSIPFDLGLGVLLFRTVRSATGSDDDGRFAAALYLLNPAVVLVGPAWGQVDGMGALPMVAAIVAVARGRVAAAGVLAVVAGLVKPQFGVAAFVIAGLALFWLRSPAGFRRLAWLAVAVAAAFAVVLLPLGLDPQRYMNVIGATFSQYPYHSGFAFNPWGALFGFNHDDGALVYVGTALEVAAIGASLWMLRWRRDLVGLLAVGSLIALTLYFVPTRAHERYLFGAIALLTPLAAMHQPLRRPFYALSAMFFATLAYVLANSPYRILPGDKIETFPDWAISVMSIVMTALGAWVALRLVRLLRPGEPRANARNRTEASRGRALVNVAGTSPPPPRIEPGPGQESVWDYPRPPRVEPVPERIRVVVDGIELAASVRARRVLETAGPPVYYVPPEDVRLDLLARTGHSTVCEWKGAATYWTAVLPGGRTIPNAAWSYDSPLPGFEAITRYLAFYAWAVDEAWVGAERATPQPGRFYGGWVTSRVVGPFKGEPGSFGW